MKNLISLFPPFGKWPDWGLNRSVLRKPRIRGRLKVLALLHLANPNHILDALVQSLVRGPPIAARVQEYPFRRPGNQAALAGAGVRQSDLPPGIGRPSQMPHDVAEAVQAVVAGLVLDFVGRLAKLVSSSAVAFELIQKTVQMIEEK